MGQQLKQLFSEMRYGSAGVLHVFFLPIQIRLCQHGSSQTLCHYLYSYILLAGLLLIGHR